MRKKFSYVAFILLLSAIFSFGCAGKQAEELTKKDIVTQKQVSAEKIPVTVMVKYAFSINQFEEKVEKKFPQLDLIQVGNYSSNMGIKEYTARMEHDDLTDIVMQWPLDVGKEYWEERLLDLSAMPFTGNYNLAMLDNIAQDGKLFYLPGPSQMRGIVYNKTLFAENGWEVPTRFEEFIALCQEIEQSGMRSLQLGLANQEVLDTAFVGFSQASCYGKPEDMKWIEQYNAGKGSFAEHFESAFDTFQALIDAGILQPQDLDVDYSEREQMLFDRECAMVEDSVLMARMGYKINGSTDEFALMPFWNPGEDGDWVRLYPVCFIGLNQHLAEKENKEKYDLVIQIMEYISTPEGQIALSADTEATFSALNNMKPPKLTEIEELFPALEHGRYTVFPVLMNAQEALREGLAGMLTGRISKEEVAKMVDAQNISPPISASVPVLGTAERDFTMIETGNYLTDIMRKEVGCEMALLLDNGKDGVYSGKGINGRLYHGAVTMDDVIRIMPDWKYGEKGELWKVTMSGADLLTTLEYSIPIENNKTGWFYYFSGLCMEYAPSAEPGKRICSITDAEGNKIDEDRLYTIAVIEDSVPSEFLRSCEKAGLLISNLLADDILEKGTIAPSEDGRFVIAEP